jgi:hypothetical protein
VDDHQSTTYLTKLGGKKKNPRFLPWHGAIKVLFGSSLLMIDGSEELGYFGHLIILPLFNKPV